jgi:hypothetical protein
VNIWNKYDKILLGLQLTNNTCEVMLCTTFSTTGRLDFVLFFSTVPLKFKKKKKKSCRTKPGTVTNYNILSKFESCLTTKKTISFFIHCIVYVQGHKLQQGL